MVLVKLLYCINHQELFQLKHAKTVVSGPSIEIHSERLFKKSSFKNMKRTKSSWKMLDSSVA